MIDKVEMMNRLGMVDWDDRFSFMMITLISVVLKISDDGNGYDWSEVCKDEFVTFIGNQLSTMNYSDEMKNEISGMFKILAEYGEDRRDVIK